MYHEMPQPLSSTSSHSYHSHKHGQSHGNNHDIHHIHSSKFSFKKSGQKSFPIFLLFLLFLFFLNFFLFHLPFFIYPKLPGRQRCSNLLLSERRFPSEGGGSSRLPMVHVNSRPRRSMESSGKGRTFLRFLSLAFLISPSFQKTIPKRIQAFLLGLK
jgi:hypothetical protein